MTTAPASGNEPPRLTVVDGWTLGTDTPGQPTADTTQLPTLTRAHKWLIGIIGTGVLFIATLGFVGSYSAVTDLAVEKGFGDFSHAFPAGIDAGIVVFLALDLLLTWLRMPYPMLRQGAWSLTAATIAFNAAAAWPDALAVGMHAAIPVLFILAVEAARHAVGRIADITADKHIDSPPITRWILAFPSTFRIWRRMRLWQLRSYETVIDIERESAKYRAQLRAAYGRSWRRKAASHELLALRFARLGTPIADSLARHESDLAAANERQQQRQNTAITDRQNTPGASTTGDSATDSDSDNKRQQDRQDERQQTTTGATDSANKAARSTAKTETASDKNAGRTASRSAKKNAKKSTSGGSTRRPMEEWVELAGPVFHAEFRRLRQQPTGRQFADAIANAGLGDVSESTAKNIRQAVLDNEPLPSLA